MTLTETPRERRSHIFARDTNDHYVETEDCSEALFAAESFIGKIHDPCCGWGRIPEGAKCAGLTATAADIVDRRYLGCMIEDFLKSNLARDNIVCNPPFKDKNIKQFMLHALDLAERSRDDLSACPNECRAMDAANAVADDMAVDTTSQHAARQLHCGGKAAGWRAGRFLLARLGTRLPGITRITVAEEILASGLCEGSHFLRERSRLAFLKA